MKNAMNICIVYYIYINPKANWKIIVGGQIDDLINVGLNSNIYFVICANSQEYINECKNFINTKNIISKEFTETTTNNYEYPGLLKLNLLGKENPETIFLYMHSKGMVFNNGNNTNRNHVEVDILRNTIKHHRYILNIFKFNNDIDKAGIFPDHSGIIWFNFFWVRGKFFENLSEPIITSDRYYYEHKYILGGKCFNLLFFDLTTVNQIFACRHFNKINNPMKFFNYKKYISKYPDIVRNGINSKNQAYLHFITCGINEHRNLL
jgi:hypothetical protein